MFVYYVSDFQREGIRLLMWEEEVPHFLKVL